MRPRRSGTILAVQYTPLTDHPRRTTFHAMNSNRKQRECRPGDKLRIITGAYAGHNCIVKDVRNFSGMWYAIVVFPHDSPMGSYNPKTKNREGQLWRSDVYDITGDSTLTFGKSMIERAKA